METQPIAEPTQVKHLRHLLDQMDIPEKRKNNLDIPWLLNNLGIRNSGHPGFNEAWQILVNLYKL